MADMSTGAPPLSRAGVKMEEHSGWVTYAGIVLAILGVLNLIYGIGAISDSRVYAGDVTYVIGDLNTWGWTLCFIGAIQFITAFGIWNGSELARWVGVLAATANACVSLLWLPAFPFLAMALFAMDLLVIYGLIAHAGRGVRG